jgi:hypothetical protein
MPADILLLTAGVLGRTDNPGGKQNTGVVHFFLCIRLLCVRDYVNCVSLSLSLRRYPYIQVFGNIACTR